MYTYNTLYIHTYTVWLRGNTIVELPVKSCYRKPETSTTAQLYTQLLQNVTNVTRKCHNVTFSKS